MSPRQTYLQIALMVAEGMPHPSDQYISAHSVRLQFDSLAPATRWAEHLKLSLVDRGDRGELRSEDGKRVRCEWEAKKPDGARWWYVTCWVPVNEPSKTKLAERVAAAILAADADLPPLEAAVAA